MDPAPNDDSLSEGVAPEQTSIGWRTKLQDQLHSPGHHLRKLRASLPYTSFVFSFAVFVDEFVYCSLVADSPFFLHERSHIPLDKVVAWSSYYLAIFGSATALFSLIWAWITNRFFRSQRIPFLLGVLVMLLSNTILWVAPKIPGQIVGRFLQGCACAIVWTNSLASLAQRVGPERIGKYTGHMGTALVLGGFFGPLIGGSMYTAGGIHAQFGIHTGLLAADVLLRLTLRDPRILVFQSEDASRELSLEARTDSKIAPFESVGSLGIVSSAVTYGEKCNTPLRREIVQARERTWVENKPFLRFASSLRTAMALYGTMILGLVTCAFQEILPIRVDHLFHWNAVGAGLIFIPFALPSFLGIWIGHWCDRKDSVWTRSFATCGFLLMLPAISLLKFVDHKNTEQVVLLCFLLTLNGLCLPFALEPLLKEITDIAQTLEAGDTPLIHVYVEAFALFNMAWAIGNTLGPLLANVLWDHAGWNMMTLVLGLVGGSTALPVFLCCGGWFLA